MGNQPQHPWWQPRWLLRVVAVLALSCMSPAYADSTEESTAAEEQTARAQFDQAIQRLGTSDSGQAATELIALPVLATPLRCSIPQSLVGLTLPHCPWVARDMTELTAEM